jgi:uncharacterized iron-regulated protein
MKISQLFLIILFIFLIQKLSAEPIPYPIILETKTLKEIDLDFIKKEFQKHDVLVIGEEHDDKHGHKEKLKLIESIAKDHLIILLMEMFETDQQIVLNEFLNDSIDEKIFESEIKLWNNYSDYKPLVLFAKEKQIPILAANPPRRLVRILSRRGWSAIQNLPIESKNLLPTLYSVEAFIEDRYEKKISESLKGHADNSALKQMILAQHLWDASMSEKIYNAFYKTKKKIIHINGRFHSDERMGVVYRLEKMGIKVLTVSMYPEKNKPRIEDKNLADIIYITGNKDNVKIQP